MVPVEGSVSYERGTPVLTKSGCSWEQMRVVVVVVKDANELVMWNLPGVSRLRATAIPQGPP